MIFIFAIKYYYENITSVWRIFYGRVRAAND
jgi:hypothetical protein